MNYFRLHFEQPHRSELRAEHAAELTSTDALFAKLDGQIIRGRKAAWRAEVVAILAEHDETWVQIGPAQRPALAVVMRLDGEPQADLVLEALRAWTDLPDERRPGRIEVMSGPLCEASDPPCVAGPSCVASGLETRPQREARV